MLKHVTRIFHKTNFPLKNAKFRKRNLHVLAMKNEEETEIFRLQRRNVRTSKKKKARRKEKQVISRKEKRETDDDVIYTSRYIFMHRIYATISKIQLGGILCLGGLNVYTIYGDPSVDATIASFASECVPVIALTGWAGAIFAMTKYLNSRHVEYLKFCEKRNIVTFALSNMTPSPTLIPVDAKNVVLSSSLENQEENGVEIFVTGDSSDTSNHPKSMAFSLQGKAVAKVFDMKAFQRVQNSR
eukprot:g6872.t1